jgi:hypothetical protein
LKCGA